MSLTYLLYLENRSVFNTCILDFLIAIHGCAQSVLAGDETFGSACDVGDQRHRALLQKFPLPRGSWAEAKEPMPPMPRDSDEFAVSPVTGGGGACPEELLPLPPYPQDFGGSSSLPAGPQTEQCFDPAKVMRHHSCPSEHICEAVRQICILRVTAFVQVWLGTSRVRICGTRSKYVPA